jgi:hypothetical protein
LASLEQGPPLAVYRELGSEFTGKLEDNETRIIKKTGQTMIEKILSITDIVLKVLEGSRRQGTMMSY